MTKTRYRCWRALSGPKRPGMYIGSTGPRGLHHLVYEIVDNAIDEALGGFVPKSTSKLCRMMSSVSPTTGRGIPTGIHPKEGISAATVVYTILHAGGKFGGGGYKVAGGFARRWRPVVNALSEWLELTVYDGEHIHFQRFERGHYSEEMKVIGDTDRTGTMVVFKPDYEILEQLNFDYEILLNRLREQAFLTPASALCWRISAIRKRYRIFCTMKVVSAALWSSSTNAARWNRCTQTLST